jgi:hypothetical protein
MTKLRSSIIVLLGLCAAMPLAHAASAPPVPIIIANSGSINTTGYRITIMPNGDAAYAYSSLSYGGDTATHQTMLSAALAQKLFADVSAALPLAQLPVKHCPKSVSFGTITTVGYGGDTSPDISCSQSSGYAPAIYADVQNIVRFLNIAPRHKRTGLTPHGTGY